MAHKDRDAFAFVTPLISPQATKDFAKVCRLLRTTIRSVQRQSYNNIVHVIVCNSIPQFDDLDDERIQFLTVDIAPPEASDGKGPEAWAIARDKFLKQLHALRHLDERVKKVMLLDADDLVDPRLAKDAMNHKSESLILSRGGVVFEDHCRYRPYFDYFFRSGSSVIFDFARLQKMLKDQQSSERFHPLLFSLLGDHKEALTLMARGEFGNFSMLWGCYCLYLKNTGVNYTGRLANETGVPLTQELADRFALDIEGCVPGQGTSFFRSAIVTFGAILVSLRGHLWLLSKRLFNRNADLPFYSQVVARGLDRLEPALETSTFEPCIAEKRHE